MHTMKDKPGEISYFGVGFLIAFIVFVIDQFTKGWILSKGGHVGGLSAAILPFMDFVLVWNKGISYGLFAQHQEIGRYILIGIGIGCSFVMLVWISLSTSILRVCALGLIVGGALGNVFDRFIYGAVIDFILLHVGRWEWYVFNFADAAIVCGGGIFLCEEFFCAKKI